MPIMVKEKIRIGISSCLLGEKVRYDGGHKLDRFIAETLGEYFEWVPVCPEVEYGLPVPREEMRLVGDPESPRLITRRTGVDHTEGMLAWAGKRLKELEGEGLCGFIFKSRSPSSGLGGVKVYTPSGTPSKRGAGIFGGAFLKRFPLIPAEDDARLHNPALRENFIERVFVFRRWREFLKKGASRGDLVAFHTRHKLLVLAHSPRHYAALGRLAAGAKRLGREALLAEYIGTLMEALRLLATAKKNTNVLLHAMGYFKRLLSPDEKQELLEVIENFHRGLLPLVVPVTLIKHYVRKFDEKYLKGQYYLDPHPLELMLRNHV
jgi:uncharacterized protein YbgA (DUF1722 family)/uncharacterized protein YbbK (DUF523 family)